MPTPKLSKAQRAVLHDAAMCHLGGGVVFGHRTLFNIAQKLRERRMLRYASEKRAFEDRAAFKITNAGREALKANK